MCHYYSISHYIHPLTNCFQTKTICYQSCFTTVVNATKGALPNWVLVPEFKYTCLFLTSSKDFGIDVKMTWKASKHLFSLWYSVGALHLTLQPLLSSLLSLPARGTFGIPGIVCSSFLSSLLSCFSCFSLLLTLSNYLLLHLDASSFCLFLSVYKPFFKLFFQHTDCVTE